jgi:hypothetical protein
MNTGTSRNRSRITERSIRFPVPSDLAQFSPGFVHADGHLDRSLPGLRTRVNDPVGQVDTHSPQPMQRREFKITRSPSNIRASIWQRSTQVPQPAHFSDSCLAVNGLAASSDGLGCDLRRFRIAQQQPQQQHRKTISLELLGWRTRLALSAVVRMFDTSD